jgi:hypothetical protein
MRWLYPTEVFIVQQNLRHPQFFTEGILIKIPKINVCPQTVNSLPMVPFESLSQELHNEYQCCGVLINF